MPDKREEGSYRAQVQCIERIPPPGSFCPSLEHGRCECPRLSEKSEECRDEVTQRGTEELYQKESRDEVTQRGMEEPYQRQCGNT